jgi:hypothetical protein
MNRESKENIALAVLAVVCIAGIVLLQWAAGGAGGGG